MSLEIAAGPASRFGEAGLDEAFAAAGAMFMAGRYDEALQAVAGLHLRCHGDPEWLARVALLGAKVGWNAKLPRQGIRWADAALDAAALANDLGLRAQAWALKGASHALERQATLAVQCLDRGVRDLSADLLPAVRRTVLTAVGLSYQYLGLFGPAIAPLLNAYRIAKQHEGNETVLRCAVNLAYAQVEGLDIGLHDGAPGVPALLDEARALIAEIDHRLPDPASDQLFHATRDATASLAIACGDAADACTRLQSCLDRGAEPRADRRLWWYVDLAYARHLMGQRDGAAAAAEMARQLLPQVGDLPGHPVELRRRARLAVVEGDADQVQLWMNRFHARVVAGQQAMLEARAAEFNVLETTRSLHLELADLRQQRAGLREQFEALEHLARTDALTGLLNRRGLEAAVHLLAPEGLHLAVVDLDHFKRVNDRFGHAVGDEVLRQVAALMADTLRGLDRAARLGGEEFVALLAAAGDAGALQAVERLRQRVQQHAWHAVHPELAVTLSAGVVSVLEGEPLERAIARADVALYQAKADGRNRVRVAVPGGL